MNAWISFSGRTNPFLYRIAEAPMPSSCPEPSEKALKSASSLRSKSMDTSLVDAMYVFGLGTRTPAIFCLAD